MKTLKSLLLLLPFILLIHNLNGQGTVQTQVNPDCPVVSIGLTLTAGSGATITVPGGNGFDNRVIGCQTYTLQYVATASSGSLTGITFQAAGGAATPGTFSAFPGTVSTGINPNTSNTGAISTFSTGCTSSSACTVANAWLNVLITRGTFVGTLQLVVYGWKSGSAKAGGGGGGGGGGPTITGNPNRIVVSGAGCTTGSTATCNIDIPTGPIFQGVATAAGFNSSESFSGNFSGSGLTSGQVVLSVADIAGTAIVYVWPSTNGTAGQVLSDSGVTTCPTLPAGYPTLCHQLTWVANGGGGGSGALTQIAQQTLSSPVSFVTFSSIPATFTTLILIVSTASSTGGTGTASIQMQFNGDSGGNYDWVYILGTISAATSGDAGSQTSLFVGNIPQAGDATNSAGSATITIPSYAATTFLHNFLANNFAIANSLTGSALQLIQTGGVWNNTAAINSITLNCSSGNFIAGSVFTLYGQS